MPNEYINGLRVVQDGQKSVNLNLSNARKKTYAQLQQMTDEQKKGVIIVEDYPVPEDSDYVEVTADGEKTNREILNELWTLIDQDKLNLHSKLVVETSSTKYIYSLERITSSALFFCKFRNNSSDSELISLQVRSTSNSSYYINNISSSGSVITDSSSSKPSNGIKYTLYYDYYKNLDIHTEYLAKNCLLTGGGNVESAIGLLQGVNNVKMEIVTVDGTTDNYGDIGISTVNSYTNVFILSNIGNVAGTKYYVTVTQVASTGIAIKYRSIVDGTAIGNVAIADTVLLIGY